MKKFYYMNCFDQFGEIHWCKFKSGEDLAISVIYMYELSVYQYAHIQYVIYILNIFANVFIFSCIKKSRIPRMLHKVEAVIISLYNEKLFLKYKYSVLTLCEGLCSHDCLQILFL